MSRQPRYKDVVCCVFVNTKSGGCSGRELGESFKELGINVFPLHEFNNKNNKQLDKLKSIIESNKETIVIIAGGDGTNAWGLSIVDQVCKKYKLKYPFIAPFPIGSGNDLSRSLGWGAKQP
eukprot:UN04620